MRIALISDPHLHPYDSISEFVFSDENFCRFIKKQTQQNDLFVIVGDLFEFYEGWFPFKWWIKKDLRILEQKYPKSIKEIKNNKKAVYIRGNHDKAIPLSYHSHSKYKIGNLFVEHGVYDYINKYFPICAHLLAWGFGLIKRFFNTRSLTKIITKYTGLDLFNSKGQQRKAKKHFKKNDNLTFIVNGHTHSSLIKTFIINNKVRYFINLGRWGTRTNKDLTIIDTKKNIIIQQDKQFVPAVAEVYKILKKGDILGTYNKHSLISKGIAIVTNSRYSHMVNCIGRHRAIEATAKGVKLCLLEKYFQSDHRVIVLRLKDKKIIKLFVKGLKEKLKLRYSFKQNVFDLFFLIIYWITGKNYLKEIQFDAFPQEVNCSELTASVLSEKAGYEIIPKADPSIITPNDLVTCYTYFNHIIELDPA